MKYRKPKVGDYLIAKKKEKATNKNYNLFRGKIKEVSVNSKKIKTGNALYIIVLEDDKRYVYPDYINYNVTLIPKYIQDWKEKIQ